MLNDYQAAEFDDPLGPWLTTGPNAFEPGDIPPGRGQLARNVEYKPGQVRTRYGFSPFPNLTALGDSIQAMEGWLSPTLTGAKIFLGYLAKSGSAHPGFNVVETDNGSVTNLYTPAGSPASAVFAAAGVHLYMTSVDIQGNGTDAPRVYSQTTISAPGGLDQLFQPPISISASTTVAGGTSGNLGVTVGTHRLGFLIQTRNGYTGAVSPVDGGGNFTPIVYNATLAGQTLDITVTANWPTAATGIFFIMTTADNPSQYYLVPGATVAVPGGSSFTVGTTIDIDDGTLSATGIDATPYFSLFSGTIKPSFIGEYSNRMVYVAPDPVGVQTTFISDLNNYQAISLARSVIYLPGDRQALSSFNLYGNLYIVGPHWTYQTIDNGGDPVTWASPQLIDGQIGTLSPNGSTVNSSQGLGWVADVDGLYMFAGGAYASRPVSYHQKSDWLRINWSGAPAVVRVIDSKDTQRVHVIVPLDGTTVPTHVMTWDYSRGVSPEQVNYSLDSYGNYAPGCIAIVQSTASNHVEVWLGPQTTAQPILHQNDGTLGQPYRDNGQAIASTYQTGLLPRLTENVLHHVGDHLRITGNGIANVSASTLDNGRTVPLAPITLGPSPAAAILRRYHLLSEAAALTFSTNTIDSFFVLSALIHYSKELVVFR